MPAPSQIPADANVCVSRQAAGAHCRPRGAARQAPAPSHWPSRPHAVVDISSGQASCGSIPAKTGAQIPSSTPEKTRAHVSQVPAQRRSQQNPSLQDPEAQSLSLAQRRTDFASVPASSRLAPSGRAAPLRWHAPFDASIVSVTRATRVLIDAADRSIGGEDPLRRGIRKGVERIPGS